MATPGFETIEKDFQKGQARLSALTEVFSNKASSLIKRSNILKYSVVIFGAVTAAREGIEKLFPNKPYLIMGSYTVIGILTSIIGAILAGFKYEDRANELKVLAVSSDILMEDLNNQWNRAIILKRDGEQLSSALEISQIQDTKTGEILTKGAEITNITKKILRQQSSQANETTGSLKPSA
jgi:hypothetical protein